MPRTVSSEALTAAAIASHSWGYEPVLHGVAEGHPGFSTYWEQVGARVQRTRSWHETALPDLIAATIGKAPIPVRDDL